MNLQRARLATVITAAGMTAAGLASGAGPAGAATARVDATVRAAAAARAACRAPAQRAVVHAAAAHATGSRARHAVRAVGAPPAAVIRVDQVGYQSAGSKLAVIMTRSRRAGIGWELLSGGSCRVVARGVARTDLGS